MATESRALVFYDERVLAHDTGFALHEAAPSPWISLPDEHTEGPRRLRAMVDVLRSGPLRDRLEWRSGRLATRAELLSVHREDYVDEIERICAAGGGWVTGTTRLSASSYEPLLAAAGTALEAAGSAMSGDVTLAYALVRPPGHHAQKSQADGYCFFNHAALAAQYALDHGAERVLVVDWDVHHGNGTQDVFFERDDVLTVSIHMDHGAWGPSHPQTGRPDESGAAAGAGHNVNIALPLGSGDAAYLRAIDEIVAPLAAQYRPDAIVAASGQDASAFDPNGRHNVTMAGFRELGRRVRAIADRHAGGRLIGVQEGGYNPSYAAYCLLATLEGMLGVRDGTPDPLAYVPDQDYGLDEAFARVSAALAPAWPSVFGSPTT